MKVKDILTVDRSLINGIRIMDKKNYRLYYKKILEATDLIEAKQKYGEQEITYIYHNPSEDDQFKTMLSIYLKARRDEIE